MAERNRFTNTETKILAVLSDGAFHTREELHACLREDLGPLSNLKIHLMNIRHKLESMNQTIRCNRTGGLIRYQQVKFAPLNDFARIS